MFLFGVCFIRFWPILVRFWEPWFFLDLSLGKLKYYLMWLIEIEFSEKKHRTENHMWILKIWQNWFGSVPIWYMNFPFFIFQWNLNRPMSLRMALSLFKFLRHLYIFCKLENTLFWNRNTRWFWSWHIAKTVKDSNLQY